MRELKITDVRVQMGDSAFLLDDGETSILYDSGFGFTGFAVAEKIKAQLGDRPLDHIFLTHSHYDHALGSAYILRYWNNAVVTAGSYAAGIFKRDGAKAVMRDLDRKFADKCGIGEYEFLGDELRVDRPCEDGDIVTAGDMSFEVLSLPGHTKCSVGFYCRERGLLLSSETLGVYDGKETILPSYLVGYKQSLESIDRVLELDVKQILAPHLGILNEQQTEYFLRNMRSAAEDTAQLIKDMLKAGSSTEDIVEEFKQRYLKGYIAEIYPVDAMELNTSIMVELIRKELM